ncbi:hypothetical protein [Lysinibacter sp. HNR]|uniref:hypothetical protein n=1 Tax=Lysinibacter sp. HNR TaxID=3031408 RepID=UPI0024349C26|nr:hypothetical protein [Lysinibacter sp. HNR]WGD37617.1 hypothetical protein FrondiHNR_01475 [Lysinibacter sp. HNR]
MTGSFTARGRGVAETWVIVDESCTPIDDATVPGRWCRGLADGVERRPVAAADAQPTVLNDA